LIACGGSWGSSREQLEEKSTSFGFTDSFGFTLS
jgi:hypothetical protein